MTTVTRVIIAHEARMTRGEVFQMLLTSDHSLPCSKAALELAAGVKKARCTPRTTSMTAISGAAPVLEQ